MSRLEPGRYILLSLADRDAIVERLEDGDELARRVKWAPFHDVHDEEWARGDVEAMLTVWREEQLNESELADLLTIALLITGGFLGGPEATRRIRDVVEARHARRQAEESARLTLDTAEAVGTGVTS